MDKLLKKLGGENNIGDFEQGKKEKTFTKVKDRILGLEDYNFMADLLELPKTSKGNKFLLVVVDLETNEFDIEPLKNKLGETVLKAYNKMIKRPHINLSKGDFSTDGGTEFNKLKDFLKSKNIFVRSSRKGRKTQMSTVERLNRTLGRLLNSYMNNKELEKNKKFIDWDNIKVLDVIRKDLNKIRKSEPRGITYKKINHKPSKFKVGDIVKYKLNIPQDALGNEQPTNNFRVGDRVWSRTTRKINKVLSYPDRNRYLLNGINNASYVESQLKKVDDKEEKYNIKKIIGKEKIKGKVYYKVWWTGYPKKEATLEPLANLKKFDNVKGLIKDFNLK